MKIIVGLGNPGEKYKNNRHNVGVMFLDYFINELTLLRPDDTSGLRKGKRVSAFKDDKYSHSELAKLVINNKEIILCKPQTFMNRSGTAVKSCVKRYTLNVTQDIIVVHDDLDISLGKFKIQKGSGPKLHNGIKSIEEALKTKPSFAKASHFALRASRDESEGKDFWRIRIGVDNRAVNRRVNGETYVLQDFLPEEKRLLATEIFPKLLSELKSRFLSLI